MRRLIKNKRGMSAVIGAIFTVIVFLSGFSFIMWEVTQYDSHQSVINDRNRLDQDRKNEILEISQPSTQGTTDILFNVTNQGAVTAHIVNIWIIEYDGTGVANHFELEENRYINPGNMISFTKTLADLNPSSSYMVKVVTERGNVVEKGWASLRTVLTIGYDSSVFMNKIVEVSGVLTSDGLGLVSQTINLYYRSSGSEWVLIGTDDTSADGAYSYSWTVSGLSAGNYRLKANFTGDSDYPPCSVEGDSIGIEVLQNPALTVMCIPSVVTKGDTVTISGVLTSEGLGVASKPINIYRSSVSGWVSLGSAVQTSAGTGAYVLTWTVPTNLQSGNYQFNATFNGDSQYPSCTTVTLVSLQVLDPSIGLSLLYYAPYVHRNENVTIYGQLLSQGSGVGGKQINLYISNGASWTSIGTDTTSSDGGYSYTWNVTDLAPGNYRFRTNFTGDAFYPACLAESDYIVVQTPVTALTLDYYPPVVFKNDNVTISGDLTADNVGLGSRQLILSWSNSSSWYQLPGLATTAASGAYSYAWNVTGLSAGNYRLRANFTGDTYYPACFVQSDSVGVQVLAEAVLPGTGGGLSVGPFVLLFTDTSFQYMCNSSTSTNGAAYQIDNDATRLVFSVQINNQAKQNIQVSSLSFFLIEIRDLTSQGVPGTSEVERYNHIVGSTSTSSSLVAYSDYSQTITAGQTSTLKFGASSVGGTSFISGEPMHQDPNGSGDDNWENLCWTYLVLFWRYEGDANTFGQTIAYVAIRSTA